MDEPEISTEVARIDYGEHANVFSQRDWPRPWMGAFLDSLAAMPNVSTAARQARVNRQYVYEVRARDPVFAEAWEEAAQMAADLLEANYIRWGTVGQDVTETRERYDGAGTLIERTVVVSKVLSPTIATNVLRRFKPEYREAHVVEHQGAGGGPVRVEVDRTPSRERILELARLAQQFGLPAGNDDDIDGELLAEIDEAANGHHPNGHVG